MQCIINLKTVTIHKELHFNYKYIEALQQNFTYDYF